MAHRDQFLIRSLRQLSGRSGSGPRGRLRSVSVENDPNRKSDWFSKRWVVAKTHGHPLDHRTELDYTFGLAAWPVN